MYKRELKAANSKHTHTHTHTQSDYYNYPLCACAPSVNYEIFPSGRVHDLVLTWIVDYTGIPNYIDSIRTSVAVHVSTRWWCLSVLLSSR